MTVCCKQNSIASGVYDAGQPKVHTAILDSLTFPHALCEYHTFFRVLEIGKCHLLKFICCRTEALQQLSPALGVAARQLTLSHPKQTGLQQRQHQVQCRRKVNRRHLRHHPESQ